MENEKKEVIEENENSEKEKKPNIFARAWNKTKDSVNSSILENKIESAYRNAHKEFQFFTKDSILSPSYYGVIDGNELTIFGKHEIKAYSVVIECSKEDDKPAYFVLETKETTVKATVEGVEYERPGTIVTLDGNVTEVDVIKCGKRYLIYKGPKEEK